MHQCTNAPIVHQCTNASIAIASVARATAGKNFDFFRLLSFYCSGSGFYMTTMFTVWAVYWFVVAQLVIALAGAEHFYFEWHDYERPVCHRRLEPRTSRQGPRQVCYSRV